MTEGGKLLSHLCTTTGTLGAKTFILLRVLGSPYYTTTYIIDTPIFWLQPDANKRRKDKIDNRERSTTQRE